MKRAIVLAGGKGVRLLPYTTLIPKPLVPLGGKYSILEIVIMQLANAGFNHITLAVNHLSDLIMAYFGDGSKWSIKLDYSRENEPLSTIGPLTLIQDLPEDFLVINGDILCNLDYGAFYNLHLLQKNDVTVAAYRRDVHIDFGVIIQNSNNKLIDFQEKPSYSFEVSMGIFCLNKKIIDQLPTALSYGFDTLMQDGIKNKNKIFIHSFDGYWLDIGRPQDYDYANSNFEEIFSILKADISTKNTVF
ncbi:MAG: NTP transferase domain-containing protein [Alphaproteobacteria bacterium]|nr:NTP transferase domain-containing protein [Alphaproteobacteria bacterium]